MLVPAATVGRVLEPLGERDFLGEGQVPVFARARMGQPLREIVLGPRRQRALPGRLAGRARRSRRADRADEQGRQPRAQQPRTVPVVLGLSLAERMPVMGERRILTPAPLVSPRAAVRARRLEQLLKLLVSRAAPSADLMRGDEPDRIRGLLAAGRVKLRICRPGGALTLRAARVQCAQSLAEPQDQAELALLEDAGVAGPDLAPPGLDLGGDGGLLRYSADAVDLQGGRVDVQGRVSTVVSGCLNQERADVPGLREGGRDLASHRGGRPRGAGVHPA